ncbi:hypothetical protein KZZ52_02780 [Dactylosporangium sp. AC04546]|uniref:hypothetical protein n=1 Tax=Dactylosporangium sp. AC04546 TaxID=2862460 RepID=UPI001EE107AD|nr:hypothetical protein [Dactylosporangium sp. AC04546]WVK84378.1 hypothetical protein KZZ52_02780 [Dactylosporangium sp. AC04546]
MGELVALPKSGDVFEDVRGHDRTMRVTCHPRQGTVVVSLWVDKICRASFQLLEADLPRLRSALDGMAVAEIEAEAITESIPLPPPLPEQEAS